MTSPNFRLLTLDGYDQWRSFYTGYAYFYHFALTKDGEHAPWSWLIDPRHVCSGLVPNSKPVDQSGAFLRHSNSGVMADQRIS